MFKHPNSPVRKKIREAPQKTREMMRKLGNSLRGRAAAAEEPGVLKSYPAETGEGEAKDQGATEESKNADAPATSEALAEVRASSLAELFALEERIEQLELRGRGPEAPPLEFGPLGEDQVLALLCADTGAPPDEFADSNVNEA